MKERKKERKKEGLKERARERDSVPEERGEVNTGSDKMTCLERPLGVKAVINVLRVPLAEERANEVL